jgi:hypothetical protein
VEAISSIEIDSSGAAIKDPSLDINATIIAAAGGACEGENAVL